MRRSKPTLLAAALAFLVACGGPLLYVEVTIPELDVTLPGQTVPAFTGTPTPDISCGPNCLFTELDYDLGDSVPLLGEKNVTVDLRMTQMNLKIDAGVNDLDGVKSVTLKLVDPADPTRMITAASYYRTTRHVQSFTVAGNANLDLGSYLQGTKFKGRAELIYDAQTPEFTATVGARFSLVLKVDYGTYVGL
mgnify:FL=1